MTPLEVVEALRDNIKNSEKMFTNGKCFQLYCVLKQLFPCAEAWYDGIIAHVYTKIGSKWYDINGEHASIPTTAYPLWKEPRIEAEAKMWDYLEKGKTMFVSVFFIPGFIFGFELPEDEDNQWTLVLDLFIIRVVIEKFKPNTDVIYV